MGVTPLGPGLPTVPKETRATTGQPRQSDQSGGDHGQNHGRAPRPTPQEAARTEITMAEIATQVGPARGGGRKHGRHRGGSRRRIAAATSRVSQRKAGRRK